MAEDELPPLHLKRSYKRYIDKVSFFRSEPMSLCMLLLHTESAFDCLVELGYVGLVQFMNIYDDDAVVNGLYVNEIKRCYEMQRIISHLQNEMEEYDINVTFYPNVDTDHIPEASDLKMIENESHKYYDDLLDVERNSDALERERSRLFERKYTVQKVDEFLTGNRNTEAIMAWSDSVVMNLVQDDYHVQPKQNELRLRYLTGTIPSERFHSFEITLWRMVRGNYFIKYADMDVIPYENNRRGYMWVRKYVFALFFVGNIVREKISKLCQGYGIRLYECPESGQERKAMITYISTDIEDLDRIINETAVERNRILLLASTDLYIWRIKIQKMLMVYYILNRMRIVKELKNARYLQVECWVPSKEVQKVRAALLRAIGRTAKDDTGVSMFPPMLNKIYTLVITKKNSAKWTVPTHFTLNKFTRGFQNLIDAYGIAAYREMNPAPYTIITFPFLFAVMFADTGHGLLMFLFGLVMVLKEKKIIEKDKFNPRPSEIVNIFFNGRYIILMMGAFSMYTGLVYNCIFGLATNMFGSHWKSTDISNITSVANEFIYRTLDPASPNDYIGTPYVIGIDPAWKISMNSISFTNSIKMKIAIILGVIHMIFGLTLSAVNYWHKHNYSGILLTFLPQLIFLCNLFLYLVIMIIHKWLKYGGHHDNAHCAPAILIMFINMVLLKNPDPPEIGCDAWLYGGQDIIQKILLFIALLCVPILLLGHPLHEMFHRRQQRKMQRHIKGGAKRTHGHGGMPMSEIWINSVIHCIESVLGSISHTASYLRLWALSLAHDALSDVLWTMVLRLALRSTTPGLAQVELIIFFFAWAMLTIGILVMMEGLSAFLHTLRLHWVEFQSKFYAGSGVKFIPFHFPESTINT